MILLSGMTPPRRRCRTHARAFIFWFDSIPIEANHPCDDECAGENAQGTEPRKGDPDPHLQRARTTATTTRTFLACVHVGRQASVCNCGAEGPGAPMPVAPCTTTEQRARTHLPPSEHPNKII